MKKAIKQKLLNLVSINYSDPIIQCSSNNKNIDLLRFIPQEELELFLTGETSTIEFNIAEYQTKLEKALLETRNIQDFLNVVNEFNCTISDYRKQMIENDFFNNKSKVISTIVESITSFVKKIVAINKMGKTYFEDTSIMPIYIATNFLVGRTTTFHYFKSPLLLFRVEISLENNKLIISKTQDELVLNEKLLVFLKKEFNEKKINISELLSINKFDELLKIIEQITRREIQYDPEQKLVDFVQEDWNNPQINTDNFQIEKSILLGIYEPDGGLLKEDLKWMIDNEIDPFECKNDKDKSVEYYCNKVIQEQPIIEIGNPLNIYQKYAIASSLSQNTLIYGPPGTGKSEIIANLIFNILLKGKTSILVSEKRAALDVLTERINSLSKFALFIHSLKDKDEFYNRLEELNQLLGPQWYREKTKGSKNAKIDPIKFSKEESMFLKNYQDWYIELIITLKEHWTIEDYNDGIYKLDYADYMNIRKELGNQIIKEWLDKDSNNKSLFDQINEIFVQYNFVKIEDFFEEYNRFVKFIKKFNLNEVFNEGNLASNLEKIIKKINMNLDVVENYLSNQKRINNLVSIYDDFLNKYNYDESKYNELFFEKTIKEKKIFIDQAISFIDFFENVISKDYLLNSKTKDELIAICESYEGYYNKHKKKLEKSNWIDFLIENKDKVYQFLSIYKTLSPENRKIFFAEFIENGSLLPVTNIEESSTLSMKQISTINKDADEIIDLFNDFVENIEIFGKPRINEIISHKKFLGYDIDFLKELILNKDAFTAEFQEIYKEWQWLSLPFIRVLYLDAIVIFDLSKIEDIMKKVSSPITTKQFKDLKIVMFWEKIIKLNEIFSVTNGKTIQDIINQLRKESERSSKIIEEITFKKYIQNLRTYLSKLPQEEKEEVATIFKLANAKNNLPSPTKFVKHFYSALKKIYPIWVARPDNVSTIIPMNENEFDYGIFDEASQMTIERAYPTIYRCNIKIVAGDDKQLKPTSFFQTKVEDIEYDIDDFDRADSLLERAKTAWWNEYHLKNHYRSWSKSLIEFSNKYIYNNNLVIASRSDYLQKSIEVINVNGVWETYNEAEAQKVIQLLEENWRLYQKILVITFNAKQAILVENLIMEKYNTFHNDLKQKIDNNEITITNLENVQGNEGDLVILSVAYGKNPEGVLRNNFGPLNAHGGLNRLNVAITRAKQKMIVVKSLMGSEIKVANVDNENAMVFKKFIEYVDSIENETSLQDEILNLDSNLQLSFDNDIVKEIYGELMVKLPSKYILFTNLDIGTKTIDIAIINKSTKKIIKAIILERWKENRNYQLMIEDIDAQYFLEARGYSTFRIKQYEWYTQKDKIISKILNSLESNKDNKIEYIIWNENNK